MGGYRHEHRGSNFDNMMYVSLHKVHRPVHTACSPIVRNDFVV